MGTYRVKTIAMTVKNNKIAKAGDIVDETQLNSPAYELVEQGFIEVVPTDETDEADEVKLLKEDYLKAVKDKSELPGNAKAADIAKSGKHISDLKTKLTESGVEFNEDGTFVEA